MTKYIALLRGINVGGHNKVPMAQLRECLTKAGFSNVSTYIQSGNIFLQADENSPSIIATQIQTLVEQEFGVTVPVIVKQRRELQQILDNCPWDTEKKEQAYFVILNTIPNKNVVAIAQEKVYENDEYLIIKDCIYLYPKKGYGRSKFKMNYFEKILETHATARNYKTMLKLLSLSSDKL